MRTRNICPGRSKVIYGNPKIDRYWLNSSFSYIYGPKARVTDTNEKIKGLHSKR